MRRQKSGLSGSVNDLKFRGELDPRVEDTLYEREIHFPPYDAADLQATLERRSELAFHLDVLRDDIVLLCSAFTAHDRGSARQALDLIFEAGYLARRNDIKRVIESYVHRARELLEKRHIEQSPLDLTTYGHLTLLAIASLANGGPTPVPKGDVYDRYEKLAHTLDRDALSDRSVHSYLNELTMLGILSRYEHNQG